MNVLQHMIEVMAASTAAARQEKLHSMVNIAVKNEGMCVNSLLGIVGVQNEI
jgi:hypothetical protein